MAEISKFEPIAKPMGLQVNREQAILLLKGLQALPDSDRSSVVYQGLLRDVETINTLWERVLKNAKLANAQRREATLSQKGIPPKSNQQSQRPPHAQPPVKA